MVPFVDLKKQYRQHQAAFEEALRAVCEAGSFILGPEVERFEQRFAAYLGVSACVGVGTGSDALRIACQALRLGPEDEVLVPANTFIASASAVHEAGARPVVVDIDPRTYHMDLAHAASRVTPRTRALIPVHLYGQCMDMDAVAAFAAAHGLEVIEDACQAHGAKWRGQRAGSFGRAGAFSFYPAKNLGAFGDGGLLSTGDPEIEMHARLARNYGSRIKYRHEHFGGNYRLDSLQAAVLNVKLDFLDAWNRARFRAACRYADRLKDVDAVTLPHFDRDDPERHVFHLFVIQSERRDALQAFLREKGIGCGMHYPVPVHRHDGFSFLGDGPGTAPAAERAAERILSLPLFPEIEEAQIDEVCEAIHDFHRRA